MNANDLTFGIEIETIAPDTAVRNDGLRIGSYKHGIQVPYLPAGWTAEADGSIDNSNGGHKCEIVSPILRGAEGLAQVAEVLRTLEAKGHRVNASCGVHVHVGWKPRLAERCPGPAGHDRRLRREGPLRDHRHEDPRARAATAAGCGSTATRRTPSPTSTATATTP